MKDNMTLREFFNKVDNNDFDSSCSSMCEMGWYDWFCTDKSLYNRFMKLLPVLSAICKSNKIDLDKNYVFFKNNCPCQGPTYDSFSICSIETGKVLFWLGKLNYGCYGDSFSGWELNAFVGDNTTVIRGLKEIKKYFGI